MNLQSGKSFAGKTDKDGQVCLSGIPEGLYAVETHLMGFLHVRYYPVRVVALARQKLSFSLPFAEITEGGLGDESTLTGTLLKAGAAVVSAEVCMIKLPGDAKTCTATNDVGEYVLLGPAGTYQTEVRTIDGAIYGSRINMSVPGIYRNQLTLDVPPKPDVRPEK
jgi:hypothetical protein